MDPVVQIIFEEIDHIMLGSAAKLSFLDFLNKNSMTEPTISTFLVIS